MLNPVVTIAIFQKQPNPQVFSAGQVIFEEGQAGDYMYGIVKGAVDLLINGKVIETIEAGEIFGTGILVGVNHRNYTAIAQTDCQLAYLDEKRFLFAVQETPMFALNVLRNYSERLSRLQRLV
ncbi:Cyclic nucleotide-binding domain (cNMP-BD) protein [Trichormus variabilis ATCC 29413]|uniref:Cyclic nucleotide-binding domain (cNMP-BD) protein n=2 Tax=Anabaena variabilis TaxID=264691 RepID=Q3MEJ0_TRIV2|nr:MULTISPECIES: cyclic nucleotide-binding domain-containing protein [Nostocaceae]ABA20596.1 Cyclic nucleotide-binding domain (cNMP-BD) protein [Trichormus variabilis ATCC 29413]MBC1214019.1 cyclic nucleotide-binding domain-containing protein [Trichormus variabilis ARAD]MBC1254303.1 cyclic nucleotide-binding domain-containing protein [Trichormus variabilis V5]MBC1269276.1 cyclic nucleotide-binding domain-containing protein [Trichormus variabilis FSR]MBC1300761.1 cyclic nucleotide-binding domai